MLDCVPLKQIGAKDSCYKMDTPDKACASTSDCSDASICLDNGLCGTDLNRRKLYFRIDPSVECYDSTHWAWLGGLFLPSMLLYSIGIPLVFYVFMRRQSKFVTAGGPAQAVWGFIAAGFEPKYYFWELIIILRKQTLIFIIVFMSRFGATLTSMLCILSLMTALMVHVSIMPYEDENIDVLEKISMVSNIFVICIGMLFEENTKPSAYNIFWTIMLMLSFLIFYVLAGYMYIKDLKKEATEIRHGLRRLGTKKADSSKVSPIAKPEKASLDVASELKTWGQ